MCDGNCDANTCCNCNDLVKATGMEIFRGYYHPHYELSFCANCYDEYKEAQSTMNYFNRSITSVLDDLKAGEKSIARWQSEERPRLESELKRYEDKFEEYLNKQEQKQS